jgi:hypothetical protein
MLPLEHKGIIKIFIHFLMTPSQTYPTLESLLADFTPIEIINAINELTLSALISLYKEPGSLTDILAACETAHAIRLFFICQLKTN